MYKQMITDTMINPLEGLLSKRLAKLRPTYGIFQNTTMPIIFKNYEEDIRNLEVSNEDIWVTSFPKSGTTWTQEMVWLICNNLDYNQAKVYLDERFPFFELSAIVDLKKIVEADKRFTAPEYFIDSVKFIKERSGKRFIKSHLPWDLLPMQITNGTKQPKIIHVIRNPKDVCASYYHHFQLLWNYMGTIEEFATTFLSGSMSFMPYWKNVSSYWNRRHLSNILIIKYTDMKKDLPAVIRQVAAFVGKVLTDEQIEKLRHHLSFEEMKINKAVNSEHLLEVLQMYLPSEDGRPVGSFMRSGRVGSYKDSLTPELIDCFDKWILQNNGIYDIEF